MPIHAVVVDGDDGAGAPFKDQQLLVALIADEVIAALERKFLMAPNEVDQPGAWGDGRGSVLL